MKSEEKSGALPAGTYMPTRSNGTKRSEVTPSLPFRAIFPMVDFCNLANLSMILGRKLVWDGDKQEVVGDAQANRLLSRPHRHPYAI